MIDINKEIEELIESHPLEKSKWVKSIRTRIRVFNTQIFENVYNGHCKDNAEMNYTYMEKTFNKLHVDAYYDKTVTVKEYFDFCDQFEVNLNKLHAKKFEDEK